MRMLLLVGVGVACLAPAWAGTAAAGNEAPVAPLFSPERKPLHSKPFVDVPCDHWAYGAVELLRQQGLVEGYPAPTERTKSAPARPASVSGGATPKGVPGPEPPADVPPDHWAFEGVMLLWLAGLPQ